MQGAALGGEEKMLVLVRLRPLSEKEITRNEVSNWECINETTILYRNSLQERSGLPTAYHSNFVDLAGSERTSQALSVGQRLKKDCHINRSLLTLGTVIRKLSKGIHEHVNYRDSNLTRILQPALGGNARIAIIFTLSTARSHVEQSQNTLLFASCAKEVTTNAQVNVVMSDKALVKHLQKELARLESELKTPHNYL
ncbi:hypothetical protein FXO38_06547 [Capsicum annuum]|uniref:Kinesin motor domain-containing protein n=1 Tax=Capsicum annuum TaxID=4072 RepID=A0A2G2YK90_CAPAN|nr:hypothetical protein FXO38_06547 [Capsicum annuum]PHT70158.1 hypothetical protein T459_25262 [Capsicum annuum]